MEKPDDLKPKTPRLPLRLELVFWVELKMIRLLALVGIVADDSPHGLPLVVSGNGAEQNPAALSRIARNGVAGHNGPGFG